MMIIIGIVVACILLIPLLVIWFYKTFYIVVEPDEAHVRVFMGGGSGRSF